MSRTLLVAGAVLAGLSPSIATAAEIAASGATPYALTATAASKTEALTGAPSRLAALLAQQSGSALPAPASAPRLAVPAVLRSPWSNQAIALSRPALVAGRPDVFGSVALAITHTPLDRRWNAVADARVGGVAERWAASLRHRPAAERIELVNRFVNARVAFTDDERAYGRPDVWQSAADTLRRGRGDCEDYAIAKKALLRAAGFAAADLYLVIAKDLVRRSDHAILVVESGGRRWVLDNGTDRVTDAAAPSDYRPIFTYAADRRWTHGYRRDVEVPVQFASAPVAPALPTPAAGPRFRVTAADLAGLL